MKKIGMVIAVALIACAGMFAEAAQAADTAANQTAVPSIQVSGNLALVNDRIAIKANGKTYYLEGIQHLIGFVDGLKEGAPVKAEGIPLSSATAPEYAFLHLSKITFNGKDYAISQPGHREKKDSKKSNRK